MSSWVKGKIRVDDDCYRRSLTRAVHLCNDSCIHRNLIILEWSFRCLACGMIGHIGCGRRSKKHGGLHKRSVGRPHMLNICLQPIASKCKKRTAMVFTSKFSTSLPLIWRQNPFFEVFELRLELSLKSQKPQHAEMISVNPKFCCRERKKESSPVGRSVET